MSNTQRYVRILPSAVESNFWHEAVINAIVPFKEINSLFEPELLIICSPSSPEIEHYIEPHHVKEVYVYDEPREMPATEPDRIAELEARVAKLESHVGGLMMIVDRLEEMHGIGRTLMEHGSDEQPAPQAESNLDKAKRLYYKGVRFKDPLDNRIADSIEEFSMNADGDVWHVGPLGHHYICLDGQWAEIVQDEPADVKTWELTIDIPEWGLKKGQHSEYISNNMAKFSWQDYTASIPLSIMPHIANAVGYGIAAGGSFTR